VEIRLQGSQITGIFDLAAGGAPGVERGVVLLEPELVGAYYGPNREQRDLVRLSEVPSHLTDAIMAVEDRRFESHVGLDPRRIAGALIANLLAGGIRQGGSTLTQQLVKNFFLTPERTYSRKFQEAVMALLVEFHYDKSAILESYLNEIYLGQRGSTSVHGVGEAARLHFGKHVRDLDAAESATIAAIIQSPNRISPQRNPAGAIERRDLVLKLMRSQGRLGAAEYEEARAQPLRVADVTVEADNSRYFLDYLLRQLPEVYDSRMLAAAGLQIYSTLDVRLQRAAASALAEGLAEIERRLPETRSEDPLQRLQGCIVAMRPQTGEVLALVGGRSYGESQFNRCVDARRQVGSAFKPFVYAAALESRGGARPTITLASTLDDSPFEIDTPSGPWRPRNYDRTFHGSVSVREALERSLNVAAARLAQRVGIDNVVDMATRLGVTSALPSVPSLALGTAELSPLEVARAYATLASGGVRPWPHAFEDVVARDTGTLARRELRFERVISPGTAYLVTSLLQGVVDRGTASRLRSMGLRGAIAAKTGTTDDEYDLWFAGYTPQLVAVVWVGFDEPRTVGLASSSSALPIWAHFIQEALGDEVRGDFLRPPEVRSYQVAARAGLRADCSNTRSELFLQGTEPDEVCSTVGSRARSGTESTERRGFLRWLRELL
jgi:penicillin-binding protein 1B